MARTNDLSRRFDLLLAAVAAWSPGAVARAQEAVPPLRLLSEAFREAARERLAAPAPHERVGENLTDGRLARLLEDVRVELRAFEREGDDALALGFELDLAKTLSPSEGSGDPSLDLVAAGNVAFDQDSNPDDFLAAALRLRWSGSRSLGPEEVTRAALAGDLGVPEIAELEALDPERFARLAARFTRAPAPEALRSDPDFQALAEGYLESLAGRLSPELSWGFDLHAGLESKQDFSSRQVVLGSALAGRLVSFDPESRPSRLNLFDLPGALLRWVAGQDERLRFSGEAYPTIVAGLDVVDAARDEGRGALTDDESFLRARLEISLESRVLRLEDEELHLSAGWRVYQELDAPAVVRRADTDGSSHLELRLELPRGWSLTYAAGRLPLDEQDDSTFALGLEVRF